MARVKTFTNGGSLLPSDLNSIEDDYEFAFSTWKQIFGNFQAVGTAGAAGTAAGTYMLVAGNTGGGLTVPQTVAGTAFYLDPADFLANTRVTKLRLRAQLFTNATAPAINFTYGLYPIATWGGAAGAQPTVATLGAVVAGSTVAFNTPGASTQSQGNSGAFTFPAAGWYAVAVLLSGASAANSNMSFAAALHMSQV